ncbi:MAG: hypothetical protein M1821_007085 [Bathelium mastoideum]|nr:MAG: hypothetical protein M1821_007085 [Bathelium mastoideum]
MYLNVLLACIAFAATARCQSPIGSPFTNPACNELAQKYPSQLYWPGSTEYANETASFWSQTTVLTPYCVFSPSTAQDVSTAVNILEDTSTQFAVRGAGHMPNKAAASTDQGVLIVMTKFQEKSLSSGANGKVASVGPGLTWWNTYQWITSHGLMVVGGRYAPVGVPGYLLGGGISYFSGKYGWAVNNILGYQIVVANGTILEVNAQSSPDLFWALKGGSSNYGIVTRFDLRTFDLPQPVYAGTISVDTNSTAEYLEAIQSWVEPESGIDNTEVAINPNLFVFPSTGVVQGNVVLISYGNNTKAVAANASAPAVLQNFTDLPGNSTASSRSFLSFVEETLVYESRDFRNSFHATSFVAAPEVVQILNETVVPATMAQLKNIKNCYVSVTLQSVSTNWMKQAKASGGDPISLDPSKGNALALVMFIQWSDPADDNTVTAFAADVLTKLRNAAQAAKLDYPFTYLNDAASGEQIYQYYGQGSSFPKMRQVSQKYDPDGTFQYLMPGGFKIGR